ncbi:MAG: hypothetical protein BWY87_01638 [Deltaproteobacteria bacterium ADurb.Bin510]|nr:MAG: hypothetical protein BWY87_01638 [Deltaproteobacteria bacterium ADurb.Bin510]
MMASTRPSSRSSTLRFCCESPSWPSGSLSTMSVNEPMRFISRSCLRKSSKVKLPFKSLAASSSASFSSMTSSKSLTRPTISPKPRIREARPSGLNSSSLSRASPMPRNLMGLPVTSLIESAAPPRASPSSLVKITPERSSRRSNSLATLTESWPIMASTTKRMLSGRVSALICSSSCIRLSSTTVRPAVSKITVSQPLKRAASSASRQIWGGCLPGANWSSARPAGPVVQPATAIAPAPAIHSRRFIAHSLSLE